MYIVAMCVNASSVPVLVLPYAQIVSPPIVQTQFSIAQERVEPLPQWFYQVDKFFQMQLVVCLRRTRALPVSVPHSCQKTYPIQDPCALSLLARLFRPLQMAILIHRL